MTAAPAPVGLPVVFHALRSRKRGTCSYCLPRAGRHSGQRVCENLPRPHQIRPDTPFHGWRRSGSGDLNIRSSSRGYSAAEVERGHGSAGSPVPGLQRGRCWTHIPGTRVRQLRCHAFKMPRDHSLLRFKYRSFRRES